MTSSSDLIVLSHLRWDFVWQRPQHLISRLADGRRTWFVEEPCPCDVTEATLCWEDAGLVTRVWLEVPSDASHLHFGQPPAERYADELIRLIEPSGGCVVWLYTPMAVDIADRFDPSLLIYDVMDDLTSFKRAPEALRLRHHQALALADLVFAGGRSLYESVKKHNPRTFLFPSGVEPEHYVRARAHRIDRERPIAGYVGVIDERLDLDLVEELACRLSDWDIVLVGPVAKLENEALPQALNLAYAGRQPYERLPEVMGGFDVALMPFAMNEATRSISPTKTLEYLAAGLPVVSTRIPDVVVDFGSVVDLQDDAEGFASACRRVYEQSARDRDRKAFPIVQLHHWDTIALRMQGLMEQALAPEVAAMTLDRADTDDEGTVAYLDRQGSVDESELSS